MSKAHAMPYLLKRTEIVNYIN